MPVANCLNCGIRFTHGYSTTGKYCSSICSGKHKANKRLERDRALFEKGKLKGRRTIKLFLLDRDGHKCCVCKRSKWNGQPITLWCDHIDGDATNNAPDNFRLICPNCDSQTPTFGAKNYGRGRKARGLPQYG